MYANSALMEPRQAKRCFKACDDCEDPDQPARSPITDSIGTTVYIDGHEIS